jgi:CMP-N,N'-diacetyllegionaminic acid synthase
MGHDLKRLCTICARGGSKGVAGKNLRTLLGKPLIAHTIEDAKRSGMFELVAVSSDSAEILETAAAFGADQIIKRPDELASDTAGKSGAIFHAAQEIEKRLGTRFDTFADLDATAPLRTPGDVISAVRQLESGSHSNLFSVCKSRRSPYFNMVEQHADGSVMLVKPNTGFVRRQDVPPTFDMNASIYVWKRGCFMETGARVMNPACGVFIMDEHSLFDIDEPGDFEIVEFLATKLRLPPDQ